MMDSPKDFTGPVNIGNPEEFSMIQLAAKIIELTKSTSKLVYLPLPEDDPKQRQPNITMAHNKLSWKPNTSLDIGLKRTIKYFSDNLDGTNLKL